MEANKCKVSIIIPVFNSELHMRETVDSALNQTFQNFEIIIVDDGSTDQSPLIAQWYVRRYPERIRYFYQPNSGPSVARNRGLRESRGEYIAFLDADDVWLPHRLMEGVVVLDQDHEVVLVHGRTIRIDGNGKPVHTPQRNPAYLSGHIFENLFLRREHISCVTVMVRKSCLDYVGGFDEHLSRIGSEDRDLWLRVAREYKIQFINQVLAKYRVSETGLSYKVENMVQGRLYSVNKFCPANGNASELRLRRLALAQIYREYGDALLVQQEYVESRRQYLKAISFCPFALWPWINLFKASFRRVVS